MKKLSLILPLILLTGCGGRSDDGIMQTENSEPAIFGNFLLTAVRPDGGEHYSDDNGESWYGGGESGAPEVYLTLSEDGSDPYAINAELHNNSGETLHADSYYYVEKQRNGEWVTAMTEDPNVIFLVYDFAVILSPGDTYTYRLNMKNYEPIDGRYRYYAESGGHCLSAEFDFDAAEIIGPYKKELPTDGSSERKIVVLR